MDFEYSSNPLTDDQLSVVTSPVEGTIFLEGPAGTGKTTTAVDRLLELMARGVPGHQILLFVPQRTLAAPYYAALRHPGVVAGGTVSVLTLAGLSQRMLDLYWPLVGEQAGFGRPDRLPTYLNLESAQYYMARLVGPLLEQGLFESVVLDRNRLYSQILDNLNKAAVVGFPIEEISQRLKAAAVGDPEQVRIYADVQTCADLFRKYCLENNLLDFSLQVETFHRHLWPDPNCRDYLFESYPNVFADNLEEDTPVTHDLLMEWLPNCRSGLMVYDHRAGYRSFLGADPRSAYRLKELCDDQVQFDHSFVMSRPVATLGYYLGTALRQEPIPEPEVTEAPGAQIPNPRAALEFQTHRYYPQMLDWVVEKVGDLLEEGIPPSEIVVLAPFLSDALRFSLSTRLESAGIPVRSHRPSRSLREEPATECLLTLAQLAYPKWGAGNSALLPSHFDIAYALVQAIDGLDLVRSQLLTEIVYRPQNGLAMLTSFEQIRPPVQSRITHLVGERYERLRVWLEENAASTSPDELDHFLSRLFGEVLSQPGYGFHIGEDGLPNYDAGEVAANLVDSIRNFRRAAGAALASDDTTLGQEYIEMVRSGVIAAQYLENWSDQPTDAVLLAPAYTFLMRNRPVEVQFWLDVGSHSWFERLYQPLTHPYVLRRDWQPGQVWTDADEVEYGQKNLYRITLGLLRRCRYKVYLGLSLLNESGYEQRGPLLKAFQRVLRQTPGEKLPERSQDVDITP